MFSISRSWREWLIGLDKSIISKGIKTRSYHITAKRMCLLASMPCGVNTNLLYSNRHPAT